MDQLKIVALDEEDLAVLSAHIQDAVLKIADIKWLPKENRFVVVMNRFVWEVADAKAKTYERRRTVLHFDRVLGVKASRIRQDAEDAVLALLAVQFIPSEEPAGTVEVVFAGGGAIRLEVECLEAQLSDLGAAWSTENLPSHELDKTD